jgi:hypothetical protein
MQTLTQLVSGVFKKKPAPPPETLPQLVYALKQTDAARVKAICQQGADVNAYDAFSALAGVARQANPQAARDCFKVLLDHGLLVTPELKKRIYHNAPALAPLVPEVQDALELKDALANANADALRGLLARGAYFDGGMDYGAQPAIITAAQKGDVGIIDLLLTHGASLNTKISGDTSTLPLHQAAMHGQREAFLRLLDAGADGNLMWSNSDGFWTVNGMAKKCKTDPGMAAFVESVIDARNAGAALEVSVQETIKIRRPIAFKS